MLRIIVTLSGIYLMALAAAWGAAGPYGVGLVVLALGMALASAAFHWAARAILGAVSRPAEERKASTMPHGAPYLARSSTASGQPSPYSN